MREVSKQFQEAYIASNMEEETKVHLIPYPVYVHSDGSVEELSGWEMFPDTEGLVCGQKSGFFPGNLTT